MAREIVTPTLIENTITEKYINSLGVHKAYYLTPVDGYVLHDKAYDYYENFDDEGNPIGEATELGFTRGTCSCPANYDFVANPREFYAILETDVPAEQIFGGGDNNHEVMSETEETETV